MALSDADFMQAALEQAAEAADAGEVPVGAVVAIGGNIVGSGQNRSLRDADPCAHAEIVALRAAGAETANYRLPDATLYVTLEPCAMCLGAAVLARVTRVVFGAYDPKSGAAGGAIDLTESPAFNHRIEFMGGVLADESSAILRQFFAARR